MSDNHEAYTSHHFKALLRELGARHIPTPPYTPRWNGKVERLHRTLNDEWARSQPWPPAAQRPRWHPSCATTTAADHTPSATDPHAATTRGH